MDIIVGGAGDRLFGCAKRYAEQHRRLHPDREVIYLAQGQRRRLRSLVRDSEAPNLIGHSWGAADISWVIDRHGPDQTYGVVIGIDPVGKPGRYRAVEHTQARAIITVKGTGSEGRLMDGNLTARLGRRIGRPCPPTFACSAARTYDAPFAHYDMTRMMRAPGPDGRSAEDWLLSGITAPSNSRSE